jgi:hypothetical protein
MILGTIVGSVADKYGRKICCMIFGVVYSLSCVTKATAAHTVLGKVEPTIFPIATVHFDLLLDIMVWGMAALQRLLGAHGRSPPWWCGDLASLLRVRGAVWVELFVFSNVSHGMLPHFLVVDDRFALQGRLQRRSAR